MTEIQRKLALNIFDVGAVKDRSRSPNGKGFRLKLHETQPDAPLSPFYLNLRTENNPKPGPLTAEILMACGEEMYLAAQAAGFEYDYIVGVPNAGDPFAEAFKQADGRYGRNAQLLQMKKTGGVNQRQIASLITPAESGKWCVVVDDLITRAGSKIEAIRVLEQAGLRVRGTIVLVDREQGGIKELERSGYGQCVAVYRVSEMLRIYRTSGRLTQECYDEIVTYLFPEAA